MKKYIVCIIFLFFIGPPPIYCHPFIVNVVTDKTTDNDNTEIIIYYSKEIEPNFSVIKILDHSDNKIDNDYINYFEDVDLLIIISSKLELVYTITSKVLSKIDGHVAENTFVFDTGNKNVNYLDIIDNNDSMFLPETNTEFPGFVGQTIVVSSRVSSLLIWNKEK